MNRSARLERATTKRRTLTWVWRFAVLAIILALIATLIVRNTVFDVFRIESVSMQPTINPGQSIGVDRTAYHETAVERGDVIVLDGRGSFDPYQRDDFLQLMGRTLRLTGGDSTYVKRVIGVAGDTVSCCGPDGRVQINGQSIDEPYLYPGNAPSEQPFTVKVPEGRVWVMGDHRARSEDSRSLLGSSGGGMIPVERILGKATKVIWPLSDSKPLR
ncbi:signal peptidase I [Glutamicibacter sp. PS]|uniref:signal peptidase I n=1 Tax=Glutamicibacter sp. PS TaxID=3075634 RepID=UPI002852C4F7|nr:signal peptidase I [Glutamicibacter sp. PS]